MIARDYKHEIIQCVLNKSGGGGTFVKAGAQWSTVIAGNRWEHSTSFKSVGAVYLLHHLVGAVYLLHVTSATPLQIILQTVCGKQQWIRLIPDSKIMLDCWHLAKHQLTFDNVSSGRILTFYTYTFLDQHLYKQEYGFACYAKLSWRIGQLLKKKMVWDCRIHTFDNFV